nr:reverse transcriptase domain-containing protein [Tanacetum cinerariifolium]
MQTQSSSRLASDQSSNPTSSMNSNPKGRNRGHSKQRVENSNLEKHFPPVITMADQRTMAQLLQEPTENKQFFGHDKEDPHAHIRYFNKITSTLKFLNVPNTSIKLMLFPFSLEGAARIWLEKEPPRSILTWDDLVLKFINQFFPPSKTTSLRNEITNFQQRFDETLSEAWDRFKVLLRARLHHGIPTSSEDFPLPEQLPTAKEDKFPLLIQSDATADELCTAAEVIEFGDSYEAPKEDATTTSDGSAKKKGRTVTVTTEDMQKRKNDVKARTTLLLSLPNEYQLRFTTKKTKKNLLKEQYGNFKAEDTETLEQTFNRLQVIVSQLEFMDIEIEHDDLNQKFLTSLAPEWLMHTIIWRNMTKHSSGNEEVNTTSVSAASINVSPAGANIGAASISQDTACAYIASQSSGSQIKFKDINQIDEDDIKEMDIEWNMALLSMRADRFWKKTGKKISIQGTDVAGFDKQGSKVEEQTLKALMMIDRVGWNWSYMANEDENHALVAEEEAPTEFALMAKTSAESEILSLFAELEARFPEQFQNYQQQNRCLQEDREEFNTIITSLKALDEGYSSKNYVRKFLGALHPKWRAKVTVIEESKDLTSLSLSELIENLKVHEMIIKKDSKIVKAKEERKSLSLKAKKESSDEECSTSRSEDEKYAMAVKDFKKFIKRRDKNQRAFVGGSWSNSGEEDDEKAKDKTCLIGQT